MKFKASTIPHQYRAEYYGVGTNKKKNKYEYENVYDFKTPYISSDSLCVDIDLEDYDTNSNDVIVLPELSLRFTNDINLYLSTDKEFYDMYKTSYINNNGELIIIRDNGNGNI